jgi:hypothetical protein
VTTKDAILKEIFGQEIKTKSDCFEVELGLLVQKWLLLTTIDLVIEALDHQVDALETRRELQ